MQILTTGAAGMLGSSLVPTLVRACHDVVATDIDLSEPRPWGSAGPGLRHLDVRRRDEIRDAFAAVQPDLVIHLAAETSLEISDDDPDHAYLTNTIATKYVALQARSAGIPMVYISTAGVFDGRKTGAYTEFDKPNPVNTYGASKHEGELLVRDIVDEHFVIRAGWMVGGGRRKDHKFVSRILDQVRNGASVIHAVTDKRGTPTYTPQFSRCLLALFDSKLYGLYHWRAAARAVVTTWRHRSCEFSAARTSSSSASTRTSSLRSSSRSGRPRRSCAIWCLSCRA